MRLTRSYHPLLMRLFYFEPEAYRQEFVRQGWVHVRGGAHPELMAYLRETLADELPDSSALSGRGIRGKKGQFVFDPAGLTDGLAELFDVVGRLAGVSGAGLVVSERHIMRYNASADGDGPVRLHKDRGASQFAIGVPISVPQGSALVLYPDHDVAPNPFLDPGYDAALPRERHPHRQLSGISPVRVEDHPGDVIAFHGSAIWHGRERAAGATHLYFKLNADGADPLGEDPRTADRRRRTIEALEQDSCDGWRVGLSAGFDALATELTRRGERVELVRVWNEAPFIATPEVLDLLQTCIERRNVPQYARRWSDETVRELARRGALDILLPEGVGV